jgi:hypothetical protein
MTAIVPFLRFLIEHADIVGAVYDAIDGGLSKEEVLAGIKAAQVAAADAAVKADLGRG